MNNGQREDSAFWYYYDWCREMEALYEQEQEELANPTDLEDND
jgi:hypothetical protein